MWRKPCEISQFGKKSAKVYHILYTVDAESIDWSLYDDNFFPV